MPIYEYRCQHCNHEFERMQKFSEPPVAECPVCTGSVQKLISRSTFHLKGDGWYVTDYARKSGKNGAAENDSPSKPEAGNTESKTESTTESTSDSTSDSSSGSTTSTTDSSASTASSTASTS